MPKRQSTNILAEQELRSRSRLRTTAGRRANTDVDPTAGGNRADHSGWTIAAGVARLQAGTRRAAIDAEARAFCRAGADTSATGPAGRERLARLAGASVRDTGAVDADSGRTLSKNC